MKKGCLIAAAALVVLLLLIPLTSWTEVAKLDVTKLPRRASWQLPGRIVESLGLAPGDRVADLGAGDGYFVFPLADAVGPAGRLYAVEVEEQMVAELEEKVRKKGYANVEVVLGELDDPLLPDRAIDLVFLCNVYHHIDDRRAYFARLRADLRPGGRVAVVEMRDDLTGFFGLLSHPGHATPKAILHREMEAAGYRLEASFDFLPVQIFETFAVVAADP